MSDKFFTLEEAYRSIYRETVDDEFAPQIEIEPPDEPDREVSLPVDLVIDLIQHFASEVSKVNDDITKSNILSMKDQLEFALRK